MKKYSELISEIESINTQQDFNIKMLPHCSNLLHQLKKTEQVKLNLFNEIVKKYVGIRKVNSTMLAQNYIKKLIQFTEEYLNLLSKYNNNFVHQSDFVSSVLPEFFCLIFKKIISDSNSSLVISAQSDLIIECIFTLSGGANAIFKKKQVDIAISLPCKFMLNKIEEEISIPLLAIEMKTNLDKNMISGIEHSVCELKKTFPECKYYVVSELSDFDIKKINYASSAIDEIYILRKQKRATVRRNASSRNSIDFHLIYEITSNLIKNIENINNNKGSLNVRMLEGKLVGK